MAGRYREGWEQPTDKAIGNPVIDFPAALCLLNLGIENGLDTICRQHADQVLNASANAQVYAAIGIKLHIDVPGIAVYRLEKEFQAAIFAGHSDWSSFNGAYLRNIDPKMQQQRIRSISYLRVCQNIRWGLQIGSINW